MTDSEDERDQTYVDNEFADVANEYNELLKELEPLRNRVRKLETREDDMLAMMHPSCLCRDQIWLKDTEYTRRYDFACQNDNEEMAEMWLGGCKMYTCKPQHCVKAENGRGIQCRGSNFIAMTSVSLPFEQIIFIELGVSLLVSKAVAERVSLRRTAGAVGTAQKHWRGLGRKQSVCRPRRSQLGHIADHYSATYRREPIEMKRFRNIMHKYECLNGTNPVNKSQDKEYAGNITIEHNESRNYDDKEHQKRPVLNCKHTNPDKHQRTTARESGNDRGPRTKHQKSQVTEVRQNTRPRKKDQQNLWIKNTSGVLKKRRLTTVVAGVQR